MRKLITILFVCLLQNSFATTYYVSNSGSDAANGTSESTAWQTTARVNSQSFQSGDRVLFQRGGTWYGNIIVNQSNGYVNNVIFDAYGTGANPVITGFQTVSGWTNLGGNIWESINAVSTLPTLKLVIENGVNTAIGRTPNGDATYPFLPNYFTIGSHTGTGNGATTITSSSLTTNWAGADVVVRVNHWTLDKEPITGQTDSTISFIGQTTSDPIQNGWGFWIQNDPRTLDQQGEWYYDPSTKKLRIYSSSQPVNVQIPTIDTLFYSPYGNNYIQVNNIDFTGANTSAIVFSTNLHNTATNCNFSYIGETAIEAQNTSSFLSVGDCNFYDLGGAGVWNTDNGTDWIITNNTFKRQGLVSVIKANDYTNGAIEIFSDRALVQYNSIDSTSYEGIHFRGNDVQVKNNLVDHYGYLRDDGGGIYTGFQGETGKIIDGNIVLNSIGNSRGVGSADKAANGIYMDGLSDGVTVTNNTVAHIVSAGIFLNNDRGMNVHNNTVYDIGGDYWTKGALMVQTYDGAPYASYQRNNNVTNNIFFQKKPSQFDVFFYESPEGTNTISNFGVLDSNYYVSATTTTLVEHHPYNAGYNDIGFTAWQSASGKEVHGIAYSGNGSIDTSKIKLVYNATKNDSIVNLGANYKDVKGGTYNGSITLSPYRSAVLIYDSPLAAPPTVTTSGNQTIATNSTTVFSTPVPASGQTITGYLWTDVTGSGSATITSPTSQNTGITGLSVGTHTFRITVTQSDGQTAYAEVTITVTITNVAPTANAGPDQTIQLPTNSVSVTGSGTDSDGSISSYLWSKVSGGSVTITNPTSASTTFTGLTQGIYTFQLQVTDNQGATGIDQLTITVNKGAAPTITLSGDQTITVNNASVSATVVWASGYSGSYQWTKVSGPGTTGFGNPTASSTTVTNLQTGTYVIQCQVTQDDGQTATAQLTLHVTIPLVITPSSQSINVKTKIKFINDKQ